MPLDAIHRLLAQDVRQRIARVGGAQGGSNPRRILSLKAASREDDPNPLLRDQAAPVREDYRAEKRAPDDGSLAANGETRACN
jgi:hypothetical protein